MTLREAIERWRADFDSVIERYAADPSVVKKDLCLRDLFLLAFPPPDLPPEPQLSPDEVESDDVINALHPYYSATKTVKKITDAKTGKTKTTTKVKLRLRDMEGVVLVLAEHGLISRNVKLHERTGRIKRRSTKKGDYVETASKLLELRKTLFEGIARFENLERDALSQGNEAQAKEYRTFSDSYRRDVERLRP